MIRTILVAIVCVGIFMSAGCAGKLMPSKQEIVGGNWDSYDEIEKFSDGIQDGVTTIGDLKKRGFDPAAALNCTRLSHVDVQNIFVAPVSNAFSVEGTFGSYIPRGVLECLDESIPGECFGYRIERKNILSKGEGNFVLHFSKFKMKTRITGWEREEYFVVKGGGDSAVIVHSVFKATPKIDRLTIEKDPKYAILGAGFILFKILSPF